MTLHQLQGTLITYEMRKSSSTSKETTFKAEKQEESDLGLTHAREALLVGMCKIIV